MPGYKRKTIAERAVINARAAAYPRPLTLPQVCLLRELAVSLKRRGYFRATMAALTKRGLVESGKGGVGWRITPKGRAELRRRR